MAAPAVGGGAAVVVAREIVDRQGDRVALLLVAVVFLLERGRVVFEVVEHVERPVRRVVDQAGAGLVGRDQQLEPAPRRQVGLAHLGPAADGDDEIVREAAQEGRAGRRDPVAEAAEGLLRQRVLGHAVEVVQHGLPAPADREGRLDVGLGPVEDLGQLLPVGDVLEVEQLDRRAGDDQPVELARARLGEGLVEGGHVLVRGIARAVLGHADEREFDLERRRADDPGDLGFGLDLLRHQVYQPDLERADVLAQRRLLGHHHHALARQHVMGGQVLGDLDGHCVWLPKRSRSGRTGFICRVGAGRNHGARACQAG